MHPDVQDDAGGPQLLRVEHAQPVARVVEEAQLVHQPLGVQRPALGVAGARAQQPLPAVEQRRRCARSGAICRWWPGTPSWKTVVVSRQVGHVRDAVGQRPPHPARPAEVLGRARCSRRPRRTSGSSRPSIRRTARGCRSGRRPARRSRGRRSPAARPAAPRGRAPARAGSASSAATAPRDRPARARSSSATACFSRRSGPAPPSPRRRSRRGRGRCRRGSGTPGRTAPGRRRRPRAPRGSSVCSIRSAKPRSAPDACWAARARSRVSPPAAVRRARDEAGEEAGRPAVPAQRRAICAPSRTCRAAETRPAPAAASSAAGVALQRRRARAASRAGDGRPVLLGGGRHEVEGGAEGLQRAVDRVQVGLCPAGVVRASSAPSRSSIAARATSSRRSAGSVAAGPR